MSTARTKQSRLRTERPVRSAHGPALLIAAVATVMLLACGREGTPVGTISLLPQAPADKPPIMTFEGKRGDRISFMSNITIDDKTHPDMTLSGLKSMLREATVTVTLESPAGASKRSTCALFTGISGDQRGSLSGASVTGARNECAFALDDAGRHTVHASVSWPRGAPRLATLDVLRAPAN